MTLRKALVFAFFFFSPFFLHAQLTDEMDEGKLYAQSKQVNQFFRRFNGEEDEKGNRFYPGDKRYQSEKLRKKYLGTLFDESNTGMPQSLKVEFARQVLESNPPSLLDFHQGDWFSEVHALFTMNGKPQPLVLFMELEKSQQGYKWVISRVYADLFKPYFDRDTAKVGRFLHPLSHELDFMNLRKAFEKPDSASQYAAKGFVPDYLSLFLYEVNKGNLKFRSVTDVKFHFFQIEGWYFELAAFNRPGYNTGWLISNLVKLSSSADREIFRKYLFNE